MDFNVEKSIEILERTPDVLITMLQDISPEWTTNNEGGETWSAYDVIGHLVHSDRISWISRIDLFLSDKEDRTFVQLNRFAQFEESKGKTLTQLLEEFRKLRRDNIKYLYSKNISDKDLERKCIHPAFGEVTLSQLLSTWVAHDLDHISQITRVMAKQYTSAVGPWAEYLKILRS